MNSEIVIEKNPAVEETMAQALQDIARLPDYSKVISIALRATTQQNRHFSFITGHVAKCGGGTEADQFTTTAIARSRL